MTTNVRASLAGGSATISMAGVTVTLNFGNSAITNGAGTIAISGGETQPVVGLVDGVWVTLTVCVDTPFATSANVDTGTSSVTTSAYAPAEVSAPLSLSATNAEFNGAVWGRRFLADETECFNCSYCHIATTWPTVGGDASTDQYTVTGTQPLVSKVESHHKIVDYHKWRGYGITVQGGIETGGQASVKIDNNHHEALVIVDTETANPDGFGDRTWVYFQVQLKKDDVVFAESAKGYQAVYVGQAVYDFHAIFGVCNGVFRFSDGVTGDGFQSVTGASAPVEDGHTHEASVTGGLSFIESFAVNGCFCATCPPCFDQEENRTFTIALDTGNPAIDGTHLLTGSGCSFQKSLGGFGNAITITINRNYLDVFVAYSGGSGSGETARFEVPMTCDAFDEEEVTLTGSITGTATIGSV